MTDKELKLAFWRLHPGPPSQHGTDSHEIAAVRLVRGVEAQAALPRGPMFRCRSCGAYLDLEHTQHGSHVIYEPSGPRECGPVDELKAALPCWPMTRERILAILDECSPPCVDPDHTPCGREECHRCYYRSHWLSAILAAVAESTADLRGRVEYVVNHLENDFEFADSDAISLLKQALAGQPPAEKEKSDES